MASRAEAHRGQTIRIAIPPRITLHSLLAGPGWRFNVLWAAAGIGLLVLLWTAIALHLGNPVLLPTPAVVLDAFHQLLSDGYLLKDILDSLKRIFYGFLIVADGCGTIAML